MSDFVDCQRLLIAFVDGEELELLFDENPNPLLNLFGHWVAEGASALVELPDQKTIINFKQVTSVKLSPYKVKASNPFVLKTDNISRLR